MSDGRVERYLSMHHHCICGEAMHDGDPYYRHDDGAIEHARCYEARELEQHEPPDAAEQAERADALGIRR